MPVAPVGRAKPLDKQSWLELWVIAVCVPLFPVAALVVSFYNATAMPWWAVWLGRTTLACAVVVALWFVSRPRLRVLRRPGRSRKAGPSR